MKTKRKVSGENLVSGAIRAYWSGFKKFAKSHAGLGFDDGDPGTTRTCDLLLRRPFQAKSDNSYKLLKSRETQSWRGFEPRFVGTAKSNQDHPKRHSSGEQLVNFGASFLLWEISGRAPPRTQTIAQNNTDTTGYWH